MSGPQQDPAPASALKVTGVVIFYMVSALVMVFVNKAVLNSTPDLPFTFLLIQLLIAVLLLHLLAFFAPPSLKSKVALPDLDPEIAYKLLPVVSIGVLALAFNTLCLRNVDASFFQIARGLLLPCTILIASIHSRTSPRTNVLRAAAVVTAGFFIGISPSSYFSKLPPGAGQDAATMELLRKEKMLSLAYGTISAFLTAIHAVQVKSATRIVEGSILKLTYWSNLMSACFLLPCILLNGEFTLFVEKMLPLAPNSALYLSTTSAERVTFFVGSGVTGLFGFFLGLAGLLSIKVTSPVSHMVSSAARSVLQTLLGVVLFGEVVSERRGVSISVITAGALYYTWIQSSRAPPPPTSSTTAHEEGEEFTKGSVIRHGHTKSLATLLPLYRPRSRSGDSGSPSGSLGSISEEEEEMNEKRGGLGRSVSFMGALEEKRALMELERMPEDDRERVVSLRRESDEREKEMA